MPGLRFNFAGGYEDATLDNGSQAIDLMDRTAGHSGLDGRQAVRHAKHRIAFCPPMSSMKLLAGTMRQAANSTSRLRRPIRRAFYIDSDGNAGLSIPSRLLPYTLKPDPGEFAGL